MKTALIIGVNGQDGSYIAGHLSQLSWSVVGIARQDYARTEVANLLTDYHKVNLNDLAAIGPVIETHDPDLIVYAAAMHGAAGFPYEDNWLSTHNVNTLSLHAILEVLRVKSINAQVIYLSSAKVFGGLGGRVISELTPRLGGCLYSISKNSAGDLLRYYREKHGLDCSIVWLFNHESERRNESFFITKLLKGLRKCQEDPKYIVELVTLDFWCDWGSASEYMKLIANSVSNINGEDVVLATGHTVYARTLVEELFRRRGVDPNKNIRCVDNKNESGKKWNVNIDRFVSLTNSRPTLYGLELFEHVDLKLHAKPPKFINLK